MAGHVCIYAAVNQKEGALVLPCETLAAQDTFFLLVSGGNTSSHLSLASAFVFFYHLPIGMIPPKTLRVIHTYIA